MSKPKQSNYFKTKAFLKGLRDALGALPKESERKEIKAILDTLIEFLTSLRENFDTLPSVKDTNKASQAIQKLEELFVQAETDPILASLVGLRRFSPPKRKKPIVTEEEITKAKGVLVELKKLPVDEIRAKLQEQNFYSLSQLRAIASAMNIKPIEKLSRNSLVHQISTKIANYRGYRSLRGEATEEQ